MRCAGHVVALRPDGLAVVELVASAACARCAAGRGCGAAPFGPRVGPPRLDCAVSGSRIVSVGERVEVLVDEPGGGWLRAALLAYGLPTAGLLAGAFAPEPFAPFAALGGIALGIVAGRSLAARGLAGRRGPGDTVAGPCTVRARIATVALPESTGESS